MPKVDAIQTLRYNPHMLVSLTSEPEIITHIGCALRAEASPAACLTIGLLRAQVTVLSNRKLSLW